MRARIGGFPDHCQIFTLGPHGRFWLDGQHHVFVSTSMAGLQVGVEQISDELVHIWLYHLLIGELRIGAGVGRNVSVQPLAPPEPTTAAGDKPGDTAGDAALEMSPPGASAWPRDGAQSGSGGDTSDSASTPPVSPSGKEVSAEDQKGVA